MPLLSTISDGRRSLVAGVCGFAVGYLALQEIGLRLAFPPAGAAAFLPAVGLAVGVLSRRPVRWWPAYLAAILVLSVLGNVYHGHGAGLSMEFALANVAEAAAGAWILARRSATGAEAAEGTVPWLLRRLLPAAVAASAVGAVLGMSAVATAAGGSVAELGLVCWAWFAADAFGILTVVPVVLALADRQWMRNWPTSRIVEAAALVAVQVVLVRMVFGAAASAEQSPHWPYAVVPGVFWAAARFGPRFTVVLSAQLTTAIVAHTAIGAGPFARAQASGEQALAVQGFCVVIFTAALVMAHMIADRRAVEAVVADRSAAMVLAVEGISYVDPEGHYAWVSPAYATMLATTPDELVGRRWSPTVHPDDLDKLTTAYQDMLVSGKAAAEVRRVRADGSVSFEELTLISDRDAGGVLLGHHSFMRDITARRTVTDQLDQFFELSRDLLYVAGGGYLRRVNPAWTRLLGHSAEDLLAVPLIDFVHPDDVAMTLTVMGKVAGGEHCVDFDNRYRCADGTYRWLRWAATADPVTGMTYAVASDVTASKQTTQVLADARDQALEASRLKSQFLATMSHEIRTPMNGVIGLGDLLAGTDLDASQIRYVDGIRTAGTGLLTVINDILDFSKIESGEFILDDIDFDLTAMINELVFLMCQVAECKGLVLHTDLDPELPAIMRGDPSRLRQVLLNLVGNAVKFTETGSVTLRARIATPASGDQPATGPMTVSFDIVDTGIGIDADALGRVFDPFQQANTSTTRTYGGTGLGLAISQQIAGTMGGHITVASELGVGTTFTVSVDLLPVAGSDIRSASHDHSLLRVLIVDDDQTNRMILTEQLRHWRMRTDEAGTPAEALELLRQQATLNRRYDLAIIDMHMPEMTGLELAAAITAHPGIAQLPVILMTSNEAITSTEALQAAVSATLTKPVSQSTLYDALTTLTGTGEASTPAAPVERGRLLLVEDNDINQTVAVGILTKLGYTVDIAVDGIEAITKADQHPYQAILMDCQMPRMDGYTATAILRQQPATARTPIIAMTANAFAEDRVRCIEAGMDDYLPKPIRAHDIDATLTRWTTPAGRTGTGHHNPVPAAAITSIRERLTELLETGTPVEVAFVRKISESFLVRLPGLLTNLSTAITLADPVEIATHAHTLLGAASNLGAVDVAQICRTIEDLARSERTAEIARHHARLQAAADQARAELSACLIDLLAPVKVT